MEKDSSLERIELQGLLDTFHGPLRFQSIARLERLVETYPTYIPGLGSLAWHYLSQRQFQQAADLYQQILALAPSLQEGRALLERCQDAQQKWRELSLSLPVPSDQQAAFLTRIHHLCTYENSHPPMEFPIPWEITEHFWMAATLACLEKHDFRSAWTCLHKAGFRQEPLQTWERIFMRLLPWFTVLKGHFTWLLTLVNRYYEEHSPLERPPWALLWMFGLKGIHFEQLVHIGKSLRRLRSRAYPYFWIERAIYESALTQAPDHPQGLQGLFRVAYDEENMPQAVNHARRLKDTCPDRLDTHLSLGAASSEMQRWKEARSTYQEGLEHFPEEPDLMLPLCLVLIQLGEIERAKGYLSHLNGSQPQKVLAAFLLGTLSTEPPDQLPTLSDFLATHTAALATLEDLLESPAGPRLPAAEDLILHPCPWCGGDNLRPAVQRCGETQSAHRLGEPDKGMILYCLDCDFYHLHRGSSPDDILDSYRREYLDGMYLRIAEWCRTSEGTEDGLYGLYYKTLKWLEADPRVEFRNLAGGKALDIGCAVGAMMTILRRRGWETWGIEPSRQLAELAQQQGHQVLVGFLEDQELEMESFDLVTLMHVLEHVPQPGHLMKEVGRITRPGGHLLLSLPVIKCLQHFTTGSGYFHQPHHLSFFSPANIARLLEESGFKIIAFETPEDVVHRFEHLRRGELPWHPLLVTRMERWRLGAFLDVYAEKI